MAIDGSLLNKVFNEDCLVTLSKIPNDSIDTVITSPPYDDLRNYNGYSFDFERIAIELSRVLKYGGVICWVVNDSYQDGSRSLSSFKQALFFNEKCGLKVNDVMIFKKHNFANPSAGPRYHQIYEYIQILSKGKPKTFNPIKDHKNKYAGQQGTWGKNTSRQVDGSFIERPRKIVAEYGMRSNVWEIQTGKEGKLAHKHPAIFPLSLATDLITSWSNPNDIVYDPFSGSGTTLLASKNTGRIFVGSEISTQYCELIKQRLYTPLELAI